MIANVMNIAADLGGMAEATGWSPACRSRCRSDLGRRHRRAADVVVVSNDRADLQMADARAPRARPDGVCRRASTGGRRCRRRSCRRWNGRALSSLCSSLSSARRSLRICSSGRRRKRSRKSGRWVAIWRSVEARPREELNACRTDVVTGMFASNAIMYFIILTTAATLHAHGKTTSSPRKRPPRRCGRWRAPAPTGCSRWG